MSGIFHQISDFLAFIRYTIILCIIKKKCFQLNYILSEVVKHNPVSEMLNVEGNNMHRRFAKMWSLGVHWGKGALGKYRWIAWATEVWNFSPQLKNNNKVTHNCSYKPNTCCLKSLQLPLHWPSSRICIAGLRQLSSPSSKKGLDKKPMKILPRNSASEPKCAVNPLGDWARVPLKNSDSQEPLPSTSKIFLLLGWILEDKFSQTPPLK